MTVVHIGIMSMTVNKRGMPVPVGMRLPREIMRPVLVLVMLIVGVSMIMLQLVVGMLMLVLFG